MRPLTATVRLQFHAGFTFAEAIAVVPYLHALGISHVYASPIFQATPGSSHGYDITDPTQINAELGGRAALDQLVACLRRHDLGLVLDIVPNHMASAAPDNAWFTDVLKHGMASRYAQFFDIDWQSESSDMAGKMLLPILSEPYAAALQSGHLKLVMQGSPAQFQLAYFDRRIPLAPESLTLLLAPEQETGAAASAPGVQRLEDQAAAICAAFDTTSGAGQARMHRLLEAQHYRLAFWQNAADEINWRRFFEISDLIGVNVDRQEVFEATHALVFELYAQGAIDGVRIDHIDGLAAPEQYCRRLRERLSALSAARAPELQPVTAPIWVEKILAEHEQLEPAWQSDGTTGYEFMNQVLRVLIDAKGEAPLTKFWQTSSGREAAFEAYEQEAREQILSEHLAGEFERLCALMTALSDCNLNTRDITGVVIRRVTFALLIAFRVYRIYSRVDHITRADRATLEASAQRARQTLRPADHPALEVVLRWLSGAVDTRDEEPLLARVLARFEQLSAPLAAKAVEDTAFYRYGRLLALNEVGGSPALFCLSPAAFHAQMQARQAQTPGALNALATHDHKRGADSRARLAVFSERPEALATLVHDVATALERLGCAAQPPITPVDLLMLLQTIVGAWPLQLDVDDQAGCEALIKRLANWQEKALREAKQASNWLMPDAPYEAAAHATLQVLFSDAQLRRSIYDAVQRVAAAGAVNGLVQVMLQMACPGIPDLYQGTELWDFSLVDPDNRQAVDYALRAAALGPNEDAKGLLPHWRDGRIKQWLIARLLNWRHQHAQRMRNASYDAFEVRGPGSERVLGFVRQAPSFSLIVLVPRLCSDLVDASTLMIDPRAWGETTCLLPEGSPDASWVDVLTGRAYAAGASLALADAFDTLPGVFLFRAG